jgi:drug/metabolite transporter (DMT)-like permease
MVLTESPDWAAVLDASLPLLYAGVMSSGVAYTLQIIGQKDTDPTVASLLMSLESVFAGLGGWLLLHERLSAPELLGCGLVFGAVVLAQAPGFFRREE